MEQSQCVVVATHMDTFKRELDQLIDKVITRHDGCVLQDQGQQQERGLLHSCPACGPHPGIWLATVKKTYA